MAIVSSAGQGIMLSQERNVWQKMLQRAKSRARQEEAEEEGKEQEVASNLRTGIRRTPNYSIGEGPFGVAPQYSELRGDFLGKHGNCRRRRSGYVKM